MLLEGIFAFICNLLRLTLNSLYFCQTLILFPENLYSLSSICVVFARFLILIILLLNLVISVMSVSYAGVNGGFRGFEFKAL